MELLSDMALFVEVVRAQSFRRASESLGIPNSTLSRRISGLEKSIGLRLLHRTTRRIELTEAGRVYFERSSSIVDEARATHHQLGEFLAQPSGLVRVSLPVDFALVYLAPHLVEFSQHYPDISIELDLTSRRVDLVSEPYDVAIRMGELPDSNLIVRKLTQVPRFFYASPRYLESAGEPNQPADLTQHQCICARRPDRWSLENATQRVEVSVSGRFTLNSIGMTRRLAALGQGIALLAKEIVAADLETGDLRRILPEWHADPISVSAVTETRLLPAKTQRFIEFLAERLGSGVSAASDG